MKHLKILGLAVVSALSLMATSGAGTAAADKICTTEDCSGETTIDTLEISQVGTSTYSTTGGTTLLTCGAGEIHVSITNQGAGVDPITGSVQETKLTECTNTVPTLSNGSIDVTATGGNGTVAFTGSEITTNGIFGVSCVYGSGAALDIGAFEGTTLNVNTPVPRISGGFTCPSDVVWKASFQITNHSMVYFLNS